MRFIQIHIGLPQLHVCEAEVRGQQGVLHAVVLADVQHGVPVLQQAGGLQPGVVLGVGELRGRGALRCCGPGLQALLLLLLLLGRECLALQGRTAGGQAQGKQEGGRGKRKGRSIKYFLIHILP